MPELYAHSPLYSYVFHDITTGNNSVFLTATDGSTVTITGYSAAKGWDPVTGLGTPDAAHLIKVLG